MNVEDSRTINVVWPQEPASMVVRDTIPVCVKLCEPICADSKYEMALSWMGIPLWTMTYEGTTRFRNCREKE